MVPPPERKKSGIVWKLVKAVYGMNDSGRKWYFKVDKVLGRLGCKKAKLYPTGRRRSWRVSS